MKSIKKKRSMASHRKLHFQKVLGSMIVALALLFAGSAGAQETKTIQGMVRDVTGEPLIGASVIEKGTNNGVIPILMSYMGGAEHITGAEMQERACRLAERNIEINGLKDRISICHTDILDITAHFSPGSFDCVVTNPPYTAAGTGVINGQDSLTAARHETTASLSDFIEKAAWLLSDRGYFYMIHRPARIVDICEACRRYHLEPKYLQFISPKPGTKPNLMLIECRKNGGRELKLLDPLHVYGVEGGYSDEIRRIYGRKL